MFQEIRPRVIDYYVDSRGRRPFLEWLEDIKDIGIRARIRLKVDRLRLGDTGNSRSVGEGVFEVKMDFGPGYRAYFGVARNQVILLLWGGDKGSQSRDIQRAHHYWRDYRRQHAHET